MPHSQLVDKVIRHGAEAPGRMAYVEACSGRTLTYGDLCLRIEASIASMSSQVRPGRRILLRCSNRIEFPIWFLSLLACGASVAPVSTHLTIPELRELSRRMGVRSIVADAATCAALQEEMEEHWPLELALDGVGTRVKPTDVGEMLLASSGTTGIPKVVRRSSKSLDAVSVNMVEAIGFQSADQVVAAVPLSHSYGIEHGLLAPLWAGCTVHLCEGLDFPSISRVLAGGATIFPAVPSMIETLTNLADAPASPLKLRRVYSAGGPLPKSVYDRFQQRFGLRIGQVYGMTEIGSVTFSDPDQPAFDPSSVGRPMRDVSIRILDGEVAVRAPSMFDNYLDDSADLIEGYFRTGDLGTIDTTGNLTITGRVRLLIDAGGMKVNPTEVEGVISQHPKVRECVVVAMPQTETVHRLRAIVVPSDVAAPPSAEDIREFVRQHLATYKVPRVVEFRSSLPRTSAGKVQRHLLEGK